MTRVPHDVMFHDLDLLWQSIFTILSWAIVAIMLAIAARMCLTQRTPFYVIAMAAAGISAFLEPIYDVVFDLWFYDAHNGALGAAWTHFSAFGVPQPNWTHSGYIVLYASACLYVGRRMYEGRMTRKDLFGVWILEIVTSCVFEIVGTGTNVYTYYGTYVLRIWHYPLVIGILEGTQVVVFTLAAVTIWRRTSSMIGLLGLILVFPATMLGTNFALGGPLILALHLDDVTARTGLMWAGTLASITLCVVAVYALGNMLPRPRDLQNGLPESFADDIPARHPVAPTAAVATP